MPPKKRKAEEADGGADSSGATPAKKSKKEAAAEARARAKLWRDNRRQAQLGSAAKTSSTTTTTTTANPSVSTPAVSEAASTAPFSTGKKSPKRTATSSATTSPKRRRTPVKRAVTSTTPGSTRKSTRNGTTPSSTQTAKRSRRNITTTDFQFDEAAVVEKQSQQTASQNEDDDEEELLPLSDTKKMRRQQEGKARIEELRKKRLQSGLKVASPTGVGVEDTAEETVATPMAAATSTPPTTTPPATTTRNLTITPGTIGLSLTVHKIKGGATVTKVQPNSRYRGQIHEGDVIMSIDGQRVTSVDDFHNNTNQVRMFEIVSERKEEEGAVAAAADPPSTIATVATATSNNKTAVDPPSCSTLQQATTTTTTAIAATRQRKMPAVIANIFSQPTSSKSTTNNNNNNAHRPDANAKYNPNQPFPTQGYKMSTAAYCGCGPTPSNKNNRSATAVDDLNSTTATATRATRSGSGTLQQLRESMRNVPAVKRALVDIGEEEYDRKMPAVRPSPPGKVGSVRENGTGAEEAAPSVVEDGPDESSSEHNTNGVLKSSISRAQQLVSSVAFANRERRGKLGIKSDLNQKEKGEAGVKGMTSPSVDPPSSSSAPVAETEVDEKRAEESASAEEAHGEEEVKQVSPFMKVVKGILMLLKWASILPLAIGVIYVLSSLRGDASLDKGDSSAATENVVSPSCFMDYPSDFSFSAENVTETDGCDGNYIQCPQWGRCHGGLLRDCSDGGGEWQGLFRFVPNKEGTSCVPSDGALEIIKVVQEALANMTVSQSCRSSDMISDPTSVLLVDEEPYPLFSLDVVSWRVNEASEVDIPVSATLLLWLQPVFDSSHVTFGHLSDVDGPPDAIGLSSEVPEHKLPVPLSCQMKFMFMELFGWLLRFLYRAVVFLAQKLWQYILTYPKSTPVVVMMLVGLVSIRRKKKHRARVREIFDVVKEEAYDRLANCDGSGGYAALHLRDDVGHAMYPSNVRERLFMYNYVWPRVVIEVRADNRVRKFRKAADGKQLEHWDLNTNSKRGWQLRKTPNKTPGKSMEATSNAKRDP